LTAVVRYGAEMPYHRIRRSENQGTGTGSPLRESGTVTTVAAGAENDVRYAVAPAVQHPGRGL